MMLDHATCHRIISARDARYDGKFFTCVKTTGIYCRPVCPARTPAERNCTFVASAAAAEEAGYRACLRCRPESSPDLGAWRGTSASVSRALRLIENGALDEGSVEELASRLGLGERQLRRLFREHLGATPISVAQTRRVLLAKKLIHETALPMTEVALASGFGSLRRFNETFAELYGKSPSALRRTSVQGQRGLVLTLSYSPPYDWPAIRDFLRLRAITGVELVEGDRYSRLLRIGGAPVRLTVSPVPGKPALQVEVDLADLSALSPLIAKTRRVFDLGAEPGAINDVLGRDPVLGPMIDRRPGLRLPGAWDGLEIGTRAILGQQVSVKAATTLAARLVARFGDTAEEPMAGLTHFFPLADRLAEADIAAIGLPQKRADAIRALARLAAEQPQLFDGGAEPEALRDALMALPGLGPWTAQYISMRACQDTDAFLEGDLVVRKSWSGTGDLAPPKRLAAQSENWRPWRAYAVMHLWAAANDAAEQQKDIAS